MTDTDDELFTASPPYLHGNGWNVLAPDPNGGWTTRLTEAEAKRLAACINALQGIADPAETMAKAREALQSSLDLCSTALAGYKSAEVLKIQDALRSISPASQGAPS